MLPLPDRSEMFRRLPRLVFGLILCGVGIASMVRADLGLGPWDVLHQGLSQRTGIGIGTVGIFVGLGVLLLWIPLRQRLGVGTVLNTILIGATIDAVLAVAPEPENIALRLSLVFGGVLMMGVGIGMYIGAGLGPGPRDGVMTAFADRGYSVRVVRTLIELSALGAGALLGGSVGLGTVLFALLIGPIVHHTLPWLTIAPRPEVEATAGEEPAEARAL
ncbi:MAG: YczE/YyaS/YitT family protein [Acidimicrobiia bacterium]